MNGIGSARRANDPRQPDELGVLRRRMREATLRPEGDAIEGILHELRPLDPQLREAHDRALRWVNTARTGRQPRSFVGSVLEQFPLDAPHGKALMSLAEALLRTPDTRRADQLVAERLAALHSAGVPGSDDLLLRAGFALLLSAGRLLPDVPSELAGRFSLTSITGALLAPAVRTALRHAMQMLGESFIVGETIEAALERCRTDPALALCSFDMLGEGARTEEDARRYYESYARTIGALASQPGESVHRCPGISVKLSALEPRYTLLQVERVRTELVPRVIELARTAARAGIGFTVDAEEADRLDLSLEIIEALARDRETRDWPGLGLAIQAYSRRAPLLIEWVARLARETRRLMTARLVKGAYWDTEIKRGQERGLASYPVYTSKPATDASYLACTHRLFAALDGLYPQFATHNAHTLAAVLTLAPPGAQYELQRLHGMGELLFETARADAGELPPVRVYAPVGTYQDLLPYLVRRLLENGANSSFVHHFLDPQVSAEAVISDPIAALTRGLKDETVKMPAAIREPHALYSPERLNSTGADLGDPAQIAILQAELRANATAVVAGGPILSGKQVQDAQTPLVSPASFLEIVGLSRDATDAEVSRALEAASRSQPQWDATSPSERAACFERAADLLERRRGRYLSLLVREAGKTIPDSLSELREAADFCRYYAATGRELFGSPRALRGPTGELNELSLHGRGVFACISPWNFPLAIFTGQVVAALMAGNAVLAKPAPATPLVAHTITRLLHEAGIPPEVLHLTPADGPAFGKIAFSHPALAGVAFTGSTATAATINRALAAREGPIVPLIAETGGVNAMIVDATALCEQVVDDAITSAFASAGQRCSALRVLYVQEEIADRLIEMLIGAMRCLVIGDPAQPATDVGPVISESAVWRLRNHAARMRAEADLLHVCELKEEHELGYFFPPHLFQLRALDQLKSEEFGPILHVARYRAEQLPQVLEAIRRTGFGLTLGVHSRLESFAEHVFRALPVGNTYVNRNMIGAVVGVQPFGGQGLSGTGPKAGGPHYLLRFATERTLTINTAALGGNLELMS
jgi:RHH-type proline utilization regulon transcriptional repressor/proline dehydrogenase/delta 1-pyrroline-5-carboxylate dehydrogenase